MRAARASSSIADCALAAARLKVCLSRRRPPTNIEAPSTSKMFPMIDPTSDAFTTSCRPSMRAKNAITSSGKFPKVTFRSPPTPGPERAASSSVAFPISAAVGTIPSAAATKIAVALACVSSSRIAAGIRGTRMYGHPSTLRSHRLKGRRLREFADMRAEVCRIRVAGS
jgi:hypothetical protein